MMYSIIIPLYNCEKSIFNTLNSIKEAQGNDYEIIAVNDGSTDKTKDIVEAFINENQEMKITLINKKNSGVSDTRNLGIDSAVGDYILFVDADDTLTCDYFVVLDNSVKSGPDMIWFGFHVFGDARRKNDTSVLEKIGSLNVDKNVLLQAFLGQQNNLFGYVWRCCFRREIMKKSKTKFASGVKLSEDYLFIFEFLMHSGNVTMVNNEIYNYIINPNSVTSKYMPTMKVDLEYINNKILSYLEDDNSFFLPSIANSYILNIQNECKTARTPNEIKTTLYDLRNNKLNYEAFKYCLKNRNSISKKQLVTVIFILFRMEKIYMFLYRMKNVK